MSIINISKFLRKYPHLDHLFNHWATNTTNDFTYFKDESNNYVAKIANNKIRREGFFNPIHMIVFDNLPYRYVTVDNRTNTITPLYNIPLS